MYPSLGVEEMFDIEIPHEVLEIDVLRFDLFPIGIAKVLDIIVQIVVKLSRSARQVEAGQHHFAMEPVLV